jgi:hypothetical protein
MKSVQDFCAAMERYRVKGVDGEDGKGARNGLFHIPMQLGKDRYNLVVVCSDAMRWMEDGLQGQSFDHVSISLQNSPRWPTHAEIKIARDLVFGPNEVVVQFHPTKGRTPSAKLVIHLWCALNPDAVAVPDPKAVN